MRGAILRRGLRLAAACGVFAIAGAPAWASGFAVSRKPATLRRGGVASRSVLAARGPFVLVGRQAVFRKAAAGKAYRLALAARAYLVAAAPSTSLKFTKRTLAGARAAFALRGADVRYKLDFNSVARSIASAVGSFSWTGMAATLTKTSQKILAAVKGTFTETGRDATLTYSGGTQQGWYASPTGSPTGAGTSGSPWSLQVALNGGYPSNTVRPGDTVWLRGGTYLGNYKSNLVGSLGSGVNNVGGKIVVRSYPGEWAKVDGSTGYGTPTGIFLLSGQYTWFRDFEIMSSDPDRKASQDGSWSPDILRGPCISTIDGLGCKLINMFIHDGAEGCELWEQSHNLEVYGCLIYNNGWDGLTDRGHGHGFYVQNASGQKWMRDNIVFQSYDNNGQIYGSGAAPLVGCTVDGNFIFQSARTVSGSHSLEFVFGGTQVATDAVFSNNCLYSDDGRGVNFGYTGGMQPAMITNNIMADHFPVMASFNNTMGPAQGDSPATTAPDGNLAFTGNWIWGQVLNENDADNQINYGYWSGNTYIAYTSSPTGTLTKVRPNAYEAGRGHVAIYNWDLNSSVSVDVSTILTVGDNYYVVNAQDPFGTPVMSGTYGGGSLSFPMTGVTPVKPIGESFQCPATGPEFNAFLIRKS